MKNNILLVLTLLMISCVEKLIEKPNDLITKDKMVAVLTDLAIVNAAKSVNVTKLREADIEPTAFVFRKHGIDSLQFVSSDQYYASIPLEYEAIYTEVEAILTSKKAALDETKKINDSLKAIEMKSKRKPVLNKSRIKRTTDSLP